MEVNYIPIMGRTNYIHMMARTVQIKGTQTYYDTHKMIRKTMCGYKLTIDSQNKPKPVGSFTQKTCVGVCVRVRVCVRESVSV